MVGGCVRHADGGAVDDESARQTPGAHPGDKAAVDLQQQSDRDADTSLAIGGGVGRTDGLPLPAEQRLDRRNYYMETDIICSTKNFQICQLYLMRKARWLAEWRDSQEKPAIYHCISRVVDRRFVFGNEEREQFRIFMRMYEKFSGCRVLSYCVMSNHFHLLLEVPPMPFLDRKADARGLCDDELLRRLRALYSEGAVDEVAAELAASRKDGDLEWVAKIHARYTYRMHDLSQFMKGLLGRFTKWFNNNHKRKGTLWEERFKSVIVESGTAARMMAAYIDLNPVRAGMVEDPAEYRWSSYGEAVGGGKKGNGKKAREGLVRAIFSDDLEVGFDAGEWKRASRRYRVLMGMALERKPVNAKVVVSSERVEKHYESYDDDKRLSKSRDNGTVFPELSMAAMLKHRVRYFTDGAVIGSKEFVNEAFAAARERFSERRKDGARRMRGSGKAAAGSLWSVRDLRVRT